MKPLYCIYCTESQRSFWKRSCPRGGPEGYQTGCLLADAKDVHETTTKLCQIERKCIPWHYLFKRVDFGRRENFVSSERGYAVICETEALPIREPIKDLNEEGWKAPTIDDLNGNRDGDFDRTGVHKTNGEELEANIWDRRVRLMLRIDVRDVTESVLA